MLGFGGNEIEIWVKQASGLEWTIWFWNRLQQDSLNCHNLPKEAVEGNTKLKIVGVKAYPFWMDNRAEPMNSW